jgi:hypothetical protein
MRAKLVFITLGMAALCAACSGGSGDGDDDDTPADARIDAETDCTPGTTEECYDGAQGTENVGLCHPGIRQCQQTGVWGLCNGQVTPIPEVCADGFDNDCNGTADDSPDDDLDGFTICQGDCCDSKAAGCLSPERVGPGAIEVNGNELDDDCDGAVDNEAQEILCDSGLVSNSNSALDYAQALDLCKFTTETDPRWGVISARFALPDGTGAPDLDQRSIRGEFGLIEPQRGEKLIVISTANAAATGHTNPSPSNWQSTSHGTSSDYPADWFTANGGTIPNAPGCPNPIGQSANDAVMLELRVRAPANAQSFSLRINFMSAEFPEWVCSSFNDFFVVLLDSMWAGQPANPTDKNLAFYVDPQTNRWPVGVNLAHGNTGLFTVCQNGPIGCNGASPSTISTCTQQGSLIGTGFEVPTNGFSCRTGEPRDNTGGGTGWLTTSGNVIGGEIITLRIAIWDQSDTAFDSAAIIDGFQWSLNPSEPGTIPD